MKRLSVPLALLIAAGATGVSLAANPTTISVTGSAAVSMMPDQATVNASVVTNAESASAAVSENNARYERIVNAIVKTGIKRDDVTLSYYNVNYVPRPNPMPPNPSPYDRYGYTVSRSFAVKVRAMDRAGAVVDAATAAGATNIEGVTFGLQNPEPARREATRRAVQDARAKAEELAQAAGLHITGISSIQLDGMQGGVRPMLMAKMAPSPSTELDPGSVTVSANVTVVFAAR